MKLLTKVILSLLVLGAGPAQAGFACFDTLAETKVIAIHDEINEITGEVFPGQLDITLNGKTYSPLPVSVSKQVNRIGASYLYSHDTDEDVLFSIQESLVFEEAPGCHQHARVPCDQLGGLGNLKTVYTGYLNINGDHHVLNCTLKN